MKQFFINLISSTSDQSSKRAVLIFLAVIFGVCCIWAMFLGEVIYVIATLAGLLVTFAGINSNENIKKNKSNGNNSDQPTGKLESN